MREGSGAGAHRAAGRLRGGVHRGQRRSDAGRGRGAGESNGTSSNLCDLLALYLFSSNYTGMRYMLKNEYFDGDEIRYVSNISVISFLL